MIQEGRFPHPCRHAGTRALWLYEAVASKIEIQLHLWLGKNLLTMKGYKPLKMRRPLKMSRRAAEKLLEEINKQTSRRAKRMFAPQRGGGDELAKVMLREKHANATGIARSYAQTCDEERVSLGRPLTVDERVAIYRRQRPTEETLRRFRKLLERSQGDYQRPIGVEGVIYSEPELSRLSTSEPQ